MKEQRESEIVKEVKNSIRILWCAEIRNNDNELVVIQINQFYSFVYGN